MASSAFPKEIALCLGGGAARGAFHLGVVDVLEEHGVAIKAISGSSIGAVIGAALACEMSAKEILEIFKSREFKKAIKFNLWHGTLFRIEMEAPIIQKLVYAKSFEELKIPLSVSMLNAKTLQMHYENSGELRSKLLASSALTPLFNPIEINGELYVDGGFVDNLPIEQLSGCGYPVLAINLYPNSQRIPRTFWRWLKRNLFMVWHTRALYKEAACEYYLTNPELGRLKTFSFADIDRAFALGQESMREFLKAH
ncbi:MAG: patatin-like phospholipase family protein [Epsilonproteobacteria bacterium]|nr:patatin-like phospholipase family protein [Campylobacterota bacterium]